MPGDRRRSAGIGIALRCTKPDRIKELIHRGMDALQQIESRR